MFELILSSLFSARRALISFLLPADRLDGQFSRRQLPAAFTWARPATSQAELDSA
jgi:hypothetical protein